MATPKRDLSDEEINARKLEEHTDVLDVLPDGTVGPAPPSNMLILDPKDLGPPRPDDEQP